MWTYWTTRLSLTKAKWQLRAARARDSVLFTLCRLGEHRFPDHEDRCTRCDSARVEFWGQQVLIHG